MTDLLLLKTRVTNGLVSFHKDDIGSISRGLASTYVNPCRPGKEKNLTAHELFIISDEKGHFKYHIKSGKKVG